MGEELGLEQLIPLHEAGLLCKNSQMDYFYVLLVIST